MRNTQQGYTPQTNSESPLSTILSTPGLTLEKLPHEVQEPPPKKMTFPTLLASVGSLGILLVEQLHFLSTCQAKDSPTGARYACPSEKYLAQLFGVARETVSRCITRLSNLGIISVTHRRKRHGKWQTNLYKVINFCWWSFSKLSNYLRPKRRRVIRTSHIATPMRENINPSIPKRLGEDVKSILQTWFKRGETPKVTA